MTESFAFQIATKAIGGEVYVTSLRDPADGAISYIVGYSFRSGPDKWLSKHRFQSIDQAEAGALALSDFLGAEYRA
jgi:hypothetical protein